MYQLSVPLNFLGSVYREMRLSLTDMENMFSLLENSASIKDAPDAVPLVFTGGEIAFKNVTFGYQPDRLILKNLSFTVAPGKKVAFVGESGCGKSTILRLLYRFYNANEGNISVDGQDITKVTMESLRKQIGVIPQDTILFNDTILHNIAYGDISAPREQVMKAAVGSQIDKAVQKMTHGYDTKVGERGLKLSGGEKQRVAIARAMLKNAPILFCDEATSSLDSATEQDVVNNLNSLSQNRTTLVVAHRLSTVIDADEIFVLKDGYIAERGTHGELLMKDGIYSKLWKQQTQHSDQTTEVKVE